VPRDELADLLWSDKLPATWEKALGVLMTKLRALLEECGIDGSTALTSAFGCYKLALPAGAWIDVEAAAEALERAEAELAAGDLDEASGQATTSAALARRVFLPGEDGTWVEEKRRDLRDLLVRSLECLRDASFASGDPVEAVRYADEVIQLEPFRESGYRHLMESHVAAGNPAEALRVYERCRQFLADELGAYPSAETEAVYLEILRAENVTSEPDAPGSLPSAPRRAPPKRKPALLLGLSLLLTSGIAFAALELLAGGDASSSAVRTIAFDRCLALQYRGPGSPQRLIVADLPLQSGLYGTTGPMVDGMTLALERHGYKAGPYRVGLQVCNDAAGHDLPYDPHTCVANAQAYVANPSVIGVVGPFSSLCAKLEIPILNRARGGSVAIVSPSNTYVGLTRRASDAAKGEPFVYYPTGRRNYARVVPTDDVEVAADAMVAQRLGVKRVYVLVPVGYPTAIVDDFVVAARRLGLEIAGRRFWADNTSYPRLAALVARAGADGVFLAGTSDLLLLHDLRARLGRGFPLISSGFDPETAALGGAGGEGMTISYPGPAAGLLRGEGARFVASFSEKFAKKPDRFAVNAAQAMDVLLDAIARSDGTRASVTSKLFSTRVSNGILGSFWITPTGDTTLNAVAIYRVTGGKVTNFKTLIVPDTLVAPD
jgi:DNA-binding SARP family transcriptional activator/ABC-type branched-subunit amino acid transport system substrate-binding protein